jgi:hypothetical protein
MYQALTGGELKMSANKNKKGVVNLMTTPLKFDLNRMASLSSTFGFRCNETQASSALDVLGQLALIFC